MLTEDADMLIGECQIVISPFLVTADSREEGTLPRMRWDIGQPLSVRSERMEAQILEVCHWCETSCSSYSYLLCFSTPYIRIRATVPLSHSVRTNLAPHRTGHYAPANMYAVNSLPKTLCLEQRFYSWTTRA
jgi:hypothetical protein